MNLSFPLACMCWWYTTRIRGLSPGVYEDAICGSWKWTGDVMCREGECCIRLGWDAHNELDLTSLGRVEDSWQKSRRAILLNLVYASTSSQAGRSNGGVKQRSIPGDVSFITISLGCRKSRRTITACTPRPEHC